MHVWHSAALLAICNTQQFAHAGIIAKSSIEKCNDYGPSEPSGLNNVTCAQKMVVALTVLGGQVKQNDTL